MQPQQPHNPGFAKQWGKLVAQAWFDPDFKRRLLSEPANVMREQGMSVPAGARLKVHDAEAATAGAAPQDELEVLSRWATSGRAEEARELTLLLPVRPRDVASGSQSRGLQLGKLGQPDRLEPAIMSAPSPGPGEPRPQPPGNPTPRPPSEPTPTPMPTPRPGPQPGKPK
jgi:hypothetical protein